MVSLTLISLSNTRTVLTVYPSLSLGGNESYSFYLIQILGYFKILYVVYKNEFETSIYAVYHLHLELKILVSIENQNHLKILIGTLYP